MDPPRVRIKQQQSQAARFPSAGCSELSGERHVDSRVKARGAAV